MMRDAVSEAPVKMPEPSFCAMVRPITVEMIDTMPPSQAHHGTCAMREVGVGWRTMAWKSRMAARPLA